MNLYQIEKNAFFSHQKNEFKEKKKSRNLENRSLSNLLKNTRASLSKKKNEPNWNSHALKKGLHIGHKSLRLSKTNFWHPLMAHYFLGIRNGVSLVDPVQTRKCLLRAFYVLALILKNKTTSSEKISRSFSTKKINSLSKKNTQPQRKGHVLLVNTNPEFSRLCKNLSVLTLHESLSKKGLSSRKKEGNSLLTEGGNTNDTIFLKKSRSSLSYVHYKWVGGTLTNWKQVSKSVLTYAKFAERCEKFLYRNNIDFPRYKKIKECFHGLIRKKKGLVNLAFHEKPDLVFLMNPNENRHIIAEANKMFIPVIALVESNTCLKGISYPIPANAYSAFFIYFCLKKIIKLSTF